MLFLFTTSPVSQVLRVLDHFFVFGELHVRLLPIAPVAFALAAAAHLADKIRRTDARDLTLKICCSRFLDLRSTVALGLKTPNTTCARLFSR